MRQVFWEIWIENKQIPALLILKILLLILSIFSGFLLYGYPYSIIILLFAMPLQSINVRFAEQVEFLIPLSDQDRKRSQIQKSMIIAGIYAIANAVGYILTICFSERYQWDGEMIIFMLMMITFPFLLLFNFRILYERIKFYNFKYILIKKKTGPLSFDILTSVLAVLCILLFLFYKFAKLKEFQFLGSLDWKMLSLIIIGTVFLMLCMSAQRNCGRLVIQDYLG